MNVSAWCIKNPVPAAIFFVMLTLVGLYSQQVSKIQNMPDLDLPVVMVTAALPGASPTQLENEVARKIENSVATLQGLKHITTKVQEGAVNYTIEFRLEKPVQEAVDDVRSAISRVRADLPSDLKEPIVNKLDVASSPILAYTVRSERMDAEALSWFVDNDITKRLLNVKGVGSIGRVGGANREVSITIDPLKLQSLGITVADVSRLLKRTQIEAPGGRTDLGDGEQSVRTIATVSTAQELGQIRLPLPDGRYIQLDQIATIKDTVAQKRSAAFLDGKPVVGFEVVRSRGASEIEVGKGVEKNLAQLRAEHPDLFIEPAFDFVEPIAQEYSNSMYMLYEGAILAVIVVFIFLRDMRATFVSAVALPLSVIPTFAGMMYLGFTLNVVTLLAMSLVIGILVDDAIVEVENIVRHLHMGKTPLQAAREAADEIGLAVIATTFTLIAVFLPTAFMDGVPGKFFKQFGWTASLAVFASLVVARMLTPMMAAYMLKPVLKPGETAHEQPDGRIMLLYMKMARWCLNHRWLTSFMTAGFFVFSVALIPFLPRGFIPPDDLSQTQVYVELAPGATIEQTIATAERARQLLNTVKHVRSVYTTIGAGKTGADPFAIGSADEVRRASLTILLDGKDKRKVTKQEIENNIREALKGLPGARYKVGLGGNGEKYILVLSGDDGQILAKAAAEVEKDIRKIPGLGNIASSAALTRPEILVKPDLAKAADLGVSVPVIAETLRVATLGDYDVALPKLNLTQRQIPIVVRLDSTARNRLDILERLPVPSSKPGMGFVQLNQVATLELSVGPAVIDRYDRARNINFEIELSGTPLGDVINTVKDLPSIRNLPPGVKVTELGEAEVMNELFLSFALAMLTGVLCIYLVLVLLFKDFFQPITILAALPLSIGGAFVALLFANKSFSMSSLIGLIMLMGIATKNSILLVEYAMVARREHGMGRTEALLDACHKRAKPIMMTTIAMIAGMLPISMNFGTADQSFRSPMAIAVIGGLVTSTLLSLLVIPVVYTFLDDTAVLVKKFFGLFSRKKSHLIYSDDAALARGGNNQGV